MLKYLIGFVLFVYLTNELPAEAFAQSNTIIYPETNRVDHIDTYHGIEVSDPYRWLEDMSSDETRSWIKEQDTLLKQYAGEVEARSNLQQKIETLQNLDSYRLPVQADNKYFYNVVPAGHSQPVLYVQNGLHSTREKLLDPVNFNDKDITYRGFSPSPNGKYVAYSVSPSSSSRWRTIHILNTETGKEYKDRITGQHATLPGLSWNNTGTGFFYTRFQVPEEGKLLQTVVNNPKLYFHKVGTSQSQDRLVFERVDHPDWLFTHTISEDGKYLIIHAREGASNNNQVFYDDLTDDKQSFTHLFDSVEAAYTFLGSKGDRWWFYTNNQAKNGRIIAFNVQKPDTANWEEIVPEGNGAMAGGSLVGGNAMGIYGNRIIVMYSKGIERAVKVYDLQGDFQYEVNLPDIGSVWGGFSGRPNSTEVFYRFLGLTNPGTVYRLDIKSGESTIFKQPNLHFNPDNYQTEITYYRSLDGTKVPMFLTHKKGLKKDGSHPVFMYAYGAFGWVAFPWFQPMILSWIEMGGVYALPAIRGGGEYGESWHQEGVGINRQNAIDDYIAAARWLIDQNYTSPSKMVANGGSASGMVAAAAVVQKPDLFGGAIIDIPALDMLRYDEFTAAGAWVKEFGSADNPEEFKALYDYSPYHNIQKDQCYPPTLVTVGEEDETAVPMHGYKFVAAMQHAQKCHNPVLLKVVWDAGHTFGVNPEQRAQTWADQLAFLIRALKLKSGNNNDQYGE